MQQSVRLNGQSALITGASTGIGKAIAIEMAKEGAQVVINYVDHPENADALVQDIINSGGKAMSIQADVSNEDQVVAMFDKMISTYGTIDILVNNAGLQMDATLTEMSLHQWKTVLDVNLTGQFLCSREAAKEFKKRGMIPERSKALGKIICMSSVHEIIPWGGHANYAASKGGVSMFMKSIAQELAQFKIRVNSLAPGAIQTNINLDAWASPEALKKLDALIPYDRIGEPIDVARAAVWLASDESDYVLGTSLIIDGGMTLYEAFYHNG